MPGPAARAAAIALIAASAAVSQPPQQPPTPVRVAPVVIDDYLELRDVTGSLRAQSRARVAAVESGRVVEVLFDVAEPVKAGSVLVRIDDRRLQKELEQAESDLQVREAEVEIERTQLRTAEDDLAAYRAAEAARQGSISTIALRAAERDAAVAAARVNVAEREVQRVETTIERLKIRLEDTEVRAPFDAWVVAREVEPGEWVDPGAVVGTLVSTGTIEAWLEVPESFSRTALEADEDITIRVDTLDLELKPIAMRAVRDVDPRSRRFLMIADLEPGEHTLVPGMAVTAALPTGASARLARVPADSVLRDAGGHFLYQVGQRDPKAPPAAIRVPVQLRFSRGGFSFVDPGSLDPDAPVVTEGNERLRPMQPLQILDGAAAASEERR